MIDDNKPSPSLWQGFIFLFLSYSLFIIPSKAQSSISINKNAQLLDSIEMLKLKREFDQAINLCKEVVYISSSTDNWESQARALNELSDIYRNIGELRDAKKYLIASNDIIMEHLPQNSLELSRNIFYRGKLMRSIYANDIGLGKDSIIIFYNRAMKLMDTSKITHINFHADLLLEYGHFHRLTGDTDSTNFYYDKLINLLNSKFERIDYRRGLYLLFASMHYYGIGDHERSIILSQIASYIMQHNAANDRRRYFDCELVIANNYFEMAEYQKAANQYKLIIDLVKDEKDKSKQQLIYLFINIGQALINVGNSEKAINYAYEAIDIIKDNPEFQDELFPLYNNLAEAYENMEMFQKSENYFIRTINSRIQLYGPYHVEVYEGYRYFGEYFERRGLYGRALEYYQKSLGALFKEFKPTNIYQNPSFEGHSNTEQLFYIIFAKAGSLCKLYRKTTDIEDLQAANNLYLTGYELLDKLLQSNYLDKSSLQLFQRFEEGFNLGIDCAAQLYDITSDKKYLEQAFQFIEKNKYLLLYKSLVQSKNSKEPGSNENNKNDKILLTEIYNLLQIINTKSHNDSLFILRNQLIEKFYKKDRLNEQLANNSLSISSERETINIEDAQKLNSNDQELLIEYHWSNENIYAFILGKDLVDIINIKITPKLRTSIKKYGEALSNPKYEKSDFINYTSSAFHLYSSLLKPIELCLAENRNEIKKLIIVPDGPLSTLPFEAFISKIDTISNSYWGLEYLCRKYTMSYAYSLNILKDNLTNHKEIQSPRMLALSYSAQMDELSDLTQLRAENELPYSCEEILRIGKHMESTNYLGIEATEDIFKSQANSYSIIHLALHGQADTVDMFNSRLIFKRDSFSIEDGQLRAFELYDMNLKSVQMVVLSACETGIGKQYNGEGIFSIARGFAFAGCPSIIMSLWKVNDKTTANLIDLFYANLKDQLPKDESLRNAKLKYIEISDDVNAHPTNWAAFITLGNNQPIQIPSVNTYWNYLLIIISLIIGFSIIRRIW